MFKTLVLEFVKPSTTYGVGMKTLGGRVKARRVELDFTKKELGNLIGVSQNSIAKIESGGNTIHIAKLATALGVSAA